MSPQLSKGSRNVTLVSVSILGFLRVGKEPLAGEIVGNDKIAKCFNFNVLKKETAVRFGGTAFSCAGGEGSRTPVLDTVDASISMFRRR